MVQSYTEIKRTIAAATKSETSWQSFKDELTRNATPNIVKVDFRVTYDELEHDVALEADVTTTAPNCFLLQVFLKDIHTGIWIPELHPWELSAVEFKPQSEVTHALCGLFDHKWGPKDSGAVYEALVWGYVSQSGLVAQFGPITQQFVYP